MVEIRISEREARKRLKRDLQAKPTIWTGATCACCGGPVKAKNKVAQDAIAKRASMGFDVFCHKCERGR